MIALRAKWPEDRNGHCRNSQVDMLMTATAPIAAPNARLDAPRQRHAVNNPANSEIATTQVITKSLSIFFADSSK
jgi:hypothetical protein